MSAYHLTREYIDEYFTIEQIGMYLFLAEYDRIKQTEVQAVMMSQATVGSLMR
jgi:hypothetical protein